MLMSINNGTGSYHNTFMYWLCSVWEKCHFDTNTGNRFFIHLVKKFAQTQATIPILHPTKYRSHHYMMLQEKNGNVKDPVETADCHFWARWFLKFERLEDYERLRADMYISTTSRLNRRLWWVSKVAFLQTFESPHPEPSVWKKSSHGHKTDCVQTKGQAQDRTRGTQGHFEDKPMGTYGKPPRESAILPNFYFNMVTSKYLTLV